MPRIESSEGDRRIPRPEDILNKPTPPAPPTDDKESFRDTRARLWADFCISRGRADECQAGTDEWFACQSDVAAASEKYLSFVRHRFFPAGSNATEVTTGLNASPPPRTPRGTPESGQYSSHTRSEGDIVLRPGTVLGWRLARYRILGDTEYGMQWTAMLTFNGKDRIMVTDMADGKPTLLQPMDDDAAAAFTLTAHNAIGEGPSSANALLNLTRMAHEIDEESRTFQVPANQIVETRYAAGLMEARDYHLLR